MDQILANMNFNDIHYFIEVTKKGSLTSAAECIGISQPSLSLSIKRLEKAIGTKLFNRFKTGVKLTPAGKSLLKHAKNLEQTWSLVKSAAYGASHDIAGVVTIGCHASVATYHIPASFFMFLKEHKALNIRFMHGLSREINEAIISLQIDLGIVVNPNYHPDLIIKRIHQDKVGFWHALSHNQLDLSNSTLICDMSLKQTQELIKSFKRNGQISRIIESDNFEVLAKLARENVGIAILPESIANKPHNISLKQLMPEIYYSDDICLVYRNENRFIKSIAAIVECMKVGNQTDPENRPDPDEKTRPH